MFKCESCMKNDVCGKKVESNMMVKDLELNKAVQALMGNGFKFELECVNYVQANKVIGGKNGFLC